MIVSGGRDGTLQVEDLKRQRATQFTMERTWKVMIELCF